MDILSDSLSRLQVGIITRKKSVVLANTNFTRRIIQFLFKNGFISNYKILSPKLMLVYIRYMDGRPFVYKFERISRPGRRVYLTTEALRFSYRYRNLHNAVVSTNKGLFLLKEAQLMQQFGGELLFDIKLY